jgi:hypothetical protein
LSLCGSSCHAPRSPTNQRFPLPTSLMVVETRLRPDETYAVPMTVSGPWNVRGRKIQIRPKVECAQRAKCAVDSVS